MNAAGQWIKYDPESSRHIPLGEWCLLSMEIDGKRHCFSGVMLESSTGETTVRQERFGSFPVNDTLYYARISPPKTETK